MAILETERKHFSKQILFNLPLDFFHSSSTNGIEIYILSLEIHMCIYTYAHPLSKDTHIYMHICMSPKIKCLCHTTKLI